MAVGAFEDVESVATGMVMCVAGLVNVIVSDPIVAGARENPYHLAGFALLFTFWTN